MSKGSKVEFNDRFGIGRGYEGPVYRGDGYAMRQIVTPHGFVITYEQDDFFNMDFAWNRHVHRRQFKSNPGAFAIRRRAFAFAREIVATSKKK